MSADPSACACVDLEQLSHNNHYDLSEVTETLISALQSLQSVSFWISQVIEVKSGRDGVVRGGEPWGAGGGGSNDC